MEQLDFGDIIGVDERLSQLATAIEALYRPNPFHNWEHAKHVAVNVVRILQQNFPQTSLTEIVQTRITLIVAAIIHDAGHTGGIHVGHEEEAIQKARPILNKHFNETEIEEIARHVRGTIFADRGTLADPGQKILADADVAIVGKSLKEHIHSTARLFLEMHIDEHGVLPNITRREIIAFFSGNTRFYVALRAVSGDENNPFLTRGAVRAFPHFMTNTNTLQACLRGGKISEIISIAREEERKYRERIKEDCIEVNTFTSRLHSSP